MPLPTTARGPRRPSWLANTVVLGALCVATAAFAFAGCSSSNAGLQCKPVQPSMSCTSGSELQICADVKSNSCHFLIGYQEYTCSSCDSIYDCQLSAYTACSGGGSSGSSSGGPTCSLGTCPSSCPSGDYLCGDGTCYSSVGQIAAYCSSASCTQCSGTSSSSGSGSGGTTSACGYSSWPTTSCANCMSLSCCSTAQTCFYDSACASLYQCEVSCIGAGSTCSSNCAAGVSTNTATEYNAVISCAQSYCNGC